MLHIRLPLLVIALAAIVGRAALSQSDFGPYQTFPLSQEAKTVAVGDLNGDGRDDVAVAAWPSALFVLHQRSDGSLGTPINLYAPTLPLGLAIGDVNGDRRNDLAVGGADGQILLYYQEPGGTFGLPAVVSGYGHMNGIAFGDFNGDGLADIADTNADFAALLVSLQNPDGTFRLPAVYQLDGWNARCLTSLDCNSDGRRDLAVLLDNRACCLPQNDAGGFGPAVYLDTVWAHSLAAADVTGDGRDDIVFTVATNQPDAAVGVIAQTDGGFAPLVSYPAYDFPQPLAVADINGDGRNDIVAAHGGYEALTVFPQSAVGTLGGWFAYALPYCNGYLPGSIAAGDLNSDTLTDVVVADWWNGLVMLPHTPDGTIPGEDNTPPVCTATVSGTAGLDDWYVSAVTVTITAEDEPGGSGLAAVLYTLDGIHWVDYEGPINVSEPGVTHLACYAEDQAGNRSQTQWLEIKVDTDPPSLSIAPASTTLWPPNGKMVNLPVMVSGTDATSGLVSLHLAVVDEYGLVQPEMDVASDLVTVQLVAYRNDGDADGRVYTLVLTGADAAGNAASVAATVTVPRSIPRKPDKPGKPGN